MALGMHFERVGRLRLVTLVAWSLATLCLATLCLAMLCLATLTGAKAQEPTGREVPASGDEARILFFETKVRPILADNCYNCHSADTNSQGGLRVDDRNGLVVGGGRGPAIVPGDPDKSLLMQAVRRTHEKLKMPPDEPLNDEQIASLARWITEGAAWPTAQVPEALGQPGPEFDRLRQEHWAWQPLHDPTPPSVSDPAWAYDDIDRFLLARLEAENLAHVGDADSLTLMRRLTFDLAGRPPTLAEMDEFVAERAGEPAGVPSAAVAKRVDQLLGSAEFGERWGRHWLDVARYGESTGSARNIPYVHAWRYRDYVIDAFNADKPYDQFLREQIAGDLLPAKTPRERDELSIATGFLAVGVCDVNQRFKVRFIMDNVDEQIDTVSRAVLGLTVSCARCHDHKFDPILVTDYYALAGIFRSTERCAAVRNKMGGGGMDYYDSGMLVKLGPAWPDAEIAEKLGRAQAALREARQALDELQEQVKQQVAGADGEKQLAAAREKVSGLADEVAMLNDPAANGPVAIGAREAKVVGDTEIRIRGEAEQLGPVVPRGFPSVLQIPGARAINTRQSGRLELAAWLTSEQNPLTPRVMANRIWQHLFGAGLVQSVDNFGVTGDAPSHPELLDHLATRFVREGWSVKKLVRAIVLCRAYQLGSEAHEGHRARDPANRLAWRHAPRRLDAEEIRDAMLAAAGELSPGRAQDDPSRSFKVMELRDNGPEAEQLAAYCLASKRRSVYLPLLRGLTPRSLDVFDFAEQGMVTGHRETTVVAPQALYLLNDPFVGQEAQAFAARLLKIESLDDVERIDLAYRLALGRPASVPERERAQNYLREYAAALIQQGDAPGGTRESTWTSFCQAILASAEFRFLR